MKAKRGLLLANTRARKCKRLVNDAKLCLKERGLELVEIDFPPPGLVSEVIEKYKGEIDLIIVAGGDGTLNAVVEGLHNACLPVGIIPLGMANDLARTLGIPPNVTEAANVIARGHTKRIDLGSANRKLFFNVASLGLSVRITQRLTRDLKKRWGVFAYLKVALEVLFRARPFRARIRTETETHDVRCVQIMVGNGRHYGGGMTIAQDATIDDACLDLQCLQVERWWQIIALFPAMRWGWLDRWRKVLSLKGSSFEITTPSSHRINTDGEITEKTPVKFGVIPQALTIFVPEPR